MTPTASFFAIRKIGTDLYLPQTKSGAGFTWTSAVPIGVDKPRLFDSPQRAHAALKSWVRGPVVKVHSGGTKLVKPKPVTPASPTGLSFFSDETYLPDDYQPRVISEYEIVGIHLITYQLPQET